MSTEPKEGTMWGPNYRSVLDTAYTARGWEDPRTGKPNERAKLCSWLTERVPRGSVLDAGCRIGEYAMRLRDVEGWLGSYLGVDIDASAIEAARASCGDWGDFEVGDVRQLRFEDQEWLGVICSDVLIHMADPHQALREVWRVTRWALYLIVHISDDPGDHGYAGPQGEHFHDQWLRVSDWVQAFEALKPRSMRFERFPKYSAKDELYDNCEYGLFELLRF